MCKNGAGSPRSISIEASLFIHYVNYNRGGQRLRYIRHKSVETTGKNKVILTRATNGRKWVEIKTTQLASLLSDVNVFPVMFKYPIVCLGVTE